MDREHTNCNDTAKEASQKYLSRGVTVAGDPTGELPRDSPRVWEMPIPDWKMRIYELIFLF